MQSPDQVAAQVSQQLTLLGEKFAAFVDAGGLKIEPDKDTILFDEFRSRYYSFPNLPHGKVLYRGGICFVIYLVNCGLKSQSDESQVKPGLASKPSKTLIQQCWATLPHLCSEVTIHSHQKVSIQNRCFLLPLPVKVGLYRTTLQITNSDQWMPFGRAELVCIEWIPRDNMTTF
jgi:hypothetical protein